MPENRIRVWRCRAPHHDCGKWRVSVGAQWDRLCPTWDAAMARAEELTKRRTIILLDVVA